MTYLRYLQMMPAAGWIQFLRRAVQHVRFAPSARVYGPNSFLTIGQGTKIGRSAVLDVTGGKIEIASGCWLNKDVEIRSQGEITIGAGTTLQKGVTLNGNVRIGKGCIFAPHVFISSGKHVFDLWPELPIRLQEVLLSERRFARPFPVDWTADEPVVVDDDCWLGVNCVVMSGVNIGRGSVVGANAVVTRDVRPYTLVAGTPARPIGQRLPWMPERVLDAKKWTAIPYLYSGFEVSEHSGVPRVTFTREAKVAIPKFFDGLVAITIEAKETGVLLVDGAQHAFAPGRQKLLCEISNDAPTVWDGVHLLVLMVVETLEAVTLIEVSCGDVSSDGYRS
jgi:acetyltransferase-like isoleucine patch superfamily enzyme